VADRLFDDLDVSGALDVAISDGGDAARQLVRVLALG
jgi:cysteinyl-tRNA synthetase